MPSFNIIREHTPSKGFRVDSVIGTYDLQSSSVVEKFSGNIDLPDDWNVGLIVGKSGTGKTTIAKELFTDDIVSFNDYSSDSILDDMPDDCSVQDICKAFNSVGFSSPPSWLKPYSVLSNGEKMRVDLARAVLEKRSLFAFDEFTSVVDRNVAKIGSFAIQKAVRRMERKMIAITCHFDVEEWLLPDWVFNTDDMSFTLCEKKNGQTSDLRLSKQRKRKSIGECLVNITI